jgi:YHS domain-containing protein
MARDVVCGMQVDEQQARSQGLTSDYQGQTYYFSSPGCKRQFDENPQQYAGQPAGQR